MFLVLSEKAPERGKFFIFLFIEINPRNIIGRLGNYGAGLGGKKCCLKLMESFSVLDVSLE